MGAQRSSACAAAFLLACANCLAASDTTSVKQGERVRVKFEQLTPVAEHSGAISYRLMTVRRVGTASDLDSDTLVILPEDGGSALTIPRYRIEQIQLSQGKKSNWLKGGWIGAASAFAVGTAIGWASCAESGCEVEPMAVGLAIGGFSAVGGFGIGAGIGALSKSERWADAELPARPPVALKVRKDGSVRFAVSLRL
jgi:hypothetical protein